ncbi:MAG: TRL-like family protein [Bacteroidota bacterium]
MRSLKLLLVLAVASTMFVGCAMSSSPVMGSIYQKVKSPVTATDNSSSSKVGTAEATSILGIVATGDAGIEKAAKDAGITKIHYIDQEATSILGIYATYKIYVYGE